MRPSTRRSPNDSWARRVGCFAGIDQLDKWAGSVVRENLADFRFAGGEEVELSNYLEATSGRNKEHAFQRLCERFASRN